MAEAGSMTLKTLEQYKLIAADKEKVSTLMGDGTVVQFLAYVLEDRDDAIVTSALETIVLLCQQDACRRQLRQTYGLTQALECLKMKDSPSVVMSLADTALALLRQADRGSADGCDGPAVPPRRSPRSSRSKVVTLHVTGLVTPDDRDALEAQLVRVRGLVSIVFDMGRGRCTCRVRDHVSVASLAGAVDRTDGMAAYQVVKLSDTDEQLAPVSKRAKGLDRPRAQALPDYLPEDEPECVPGEGALAPEGFFKSAASWISSASSFVGQSFYW